MTTERFIKAVLENVDDIIKTTDEINDIDDLLDYLKTEYRACTPRDLYDEMVEAVVDQFENIL